MSDDSDSDSYETSSYSYDSTDWAAAAEVGENYTDLYQCAGGTANGFYQASVDAYLDGDASTAYDLNQAYLSMDAVSDRAWSDANSAWTSMDQTTTVTAYDVADHSAPVDTSWSADSTDTGSD